MTTRPAILLAIILSLSGCVSNTLYRDGKPVAVIQGDCVNSKLTLKANGDILWTADRIDNSTPASTYPAIIEASGNAASKLTLTGGLVIP